jgi:hypothetical protein
MSTTKSTMPPNSDDSTKFSELLPWLVNGRLERNDALWMGAWMAQHPEAQNEYAKLLATQANLVNRQLEFDAELTLNRTLKRIQDTNRAIASVTLSSKFKDWFKAQFSAMRFPPLGYVAMLVVAVQTAVMFNQKLLLDEKFSPTRTFQTTSNPSDLVLMRITFDPDIREEELRLALASVNGKIVGGPGRLGDYYVRVDGSAKDVQKKLKTYAKVNSAIQVVAVPDKE